VHGSAAGCGVQGIIREVKEAWEQLAQTKQRSHPSNLRACTLAHPHTRSATWHVLALALPRRRHVPRTCTANRQPGHANTDPPHPHAHPQVRRRSCKHARIVAVSRKHWSTAPALLPTHTCAGAHALMHALTQPPTVRLRLGAGLAAESASALGLTSGGDSSLGAVVEGDAALLACSAGQCRVRCGEARSGWCGAVQSCAVRRGVVGAGQCRVVRCGAEWLPRGSAELCGAEQSSRHGAVQRGAVLLGQCPTMQWFVERRGLCLTMQKGEMSDRGREQQVEWGSRTRRKARQGRMG